MPTRPDIAQLAALAQAAQGIPQAGAIPTPADGMPDVAAAGGGSDIQDLLLRLRTGRLSAGQLLQMVAALIGQGGGAPQQGPPQQAGPPQGGPPQGGGSPIEAAFAGQ
jgi:hypothetical protein